MIGMEFNSGLRPDTPRGLVAVHLWQLNIHQDQVRTRSRKGRQRLLAAFGFDQLVPGIGKQIAQYPPVGCPPGPPALQTGDRGDEPNSRERFNHPEAMCPFITHVRQQTRPSHLAFALGKIKTAIYFQSCSSSDISPGGSAPAFQDHPGSFSKILEEPIALL